MYGPHDHHTINRELDQRRSEATARRTARGEGGRSRLSRFRSARTAVRAAATRPATSATRAAAGAPTPAGCAGCPAAA